MPVELLFVLVASTMGLNFGLWLIIGGARFCEQVLSCRQTIGTPPAVRPAIGEVAVIIAAHNEEIALPRCIEALRCLLFPSQIYVASDGSTDNTVAIARTLGCQVLDLQPNIGKARALDAGIRAFELSRRYKAILIQDADSEIDPSYFKYALPLFDDPSVAVVAGHVLSRWDPTYRLSFKTLYTAYRTRLYRLLQAAFQYGQSWKRTRVSYIAPGFASIYRSAVIEKIDIAAAGLVIEDFNMTFEVQHKRLGRIAYSPKARCSSEDPSGFRDYSKQVLRWYLGFWQTVRRHGVWIGRFWLSLGPLICELTLICLFLLALPWMMVMHIVFGFDAIAFSAVEAATRWVSPFELLMIFLSIDYALTAIVAVIERRAVLLIYGLAFPALRLVDAVLFIMAAIIAISAHSDGRWKSPTRRVQS